MRGLAHERIRAHCRPPSWPTRHPTSIARRAYAPLTADLRGSLVRISRSGIVRASILACSATLALPGASSAAGVPGLLTGETSRHPFQIRPMRVSLIQDGTRYLGGFDARGRGDFGHITWLTWTARSATGKGAYWIDDCQPSGCASGTFFGWAARLRAFAPQGGHFTRLTLRYHVDGASVTEEWAIRHFRSPPGSLLLPSFYLYIPTRTVQEYHYPAPVEALPRQLPSSKAVIRSLE